MKLEMIKKFQCPGCIVSNRLDCFKPSKPEPGEDFFCCDAHRPGTMVCGLGSYYLGMPKGFTRVGMRTESAFYRVKNPGENHNIRLWAKGTAPTWDHLNVPVWAMKKDGYLFVRTYMPRINNSQIDVVEEGTMDMCPGARDVATFIDEID